MNGIGTERLMPETFSAVVLYEDRETRDRALSVCRHMAKQLGGEIELSFSWWKFGFLSDPKLGEQAANMALLADMLFVSARSGLGLPSTFTDWIESWLPKWGSKESVLVALIGWEHDTTENDASKYLRSLATRARMDYLAEPLLASAKPASELQNNLAEQLHPQAFTPPIRPPSHWGINE